MGASNFKASAEDKIAVYRGEIEELTAKINQVEEGFLFLAKWKNRRSTLEDWIMSSEGMIMDDDPTWRKTIKPRKRRKWRSPFKSGEIGRRALEILRVNDRWMRPRDIALLMLKQAHLYYGADRVARDKLTNSVGGYLRKHAGDLVESRGDYAKEWRLILNKATLDAGLDGLHFHDIRGTTCTMLANAECTPSEIAAMLGWTVKTVNEMLDRYQAMTAAQSDSAVAKLEARR